MELHVLKPKHGYDFLYERKLLEPLSVPEYIARQHNSSLTQTDLAAKNLVRVIVFTVGEFRRLFEITSPTIDIDKINVRGHIKEKRMSERMCILTSIEYSEISESSNADMAFPLNLGKYQKEFAKVILIKNKDKENGMEK